MQAVGLWPGRSLATVIAFVDVGFQAASSETRLSSIDPLQPFATSTCATAMQRLPPVEAGLRGPRSRPYS